MTSVQRNRTIFASRHMAQGCIVVFFASLGGCSADVTRFDFPAFSLSDNGNSTGSLPGSADPYGKRRPGAYDDQLTTPRGAGLTEDVGRTYQPQPNPYTANRGQPATGELAPATERYAARTPERNPERAPIVERRPEPPRVTAGNETIEVQPGDTLFGIAKRHGVPVGALIEVNGLQNGSSIKPGQRLALPAAGTMPQRALPETTARAPQATRPIQQTQNTATETPGWNGRYTLNPGDSLYAIARQHRTTLNDLQRVNGITDPTKVRAGTVLMVPGNGTASSEPAGERGGIVTGSGTQQSQGQGQYQAQPQPQTQTQTQTSGPRVVQMPDGGANQPRMLNGSGDAGKFASRGDTATDATDAGAAKFRWPVTGQLLAGFGRRADGTHNDGINLGVPQGTEVRAAEGGRIAYAGSELKGYGNLILIRHDNGWVTAYAHSDEILVKRDEVVKRGQVIARAGKTGSVDKPQVHFELRQGAKPIDPLPYMERN